MTTIDDIAIITAAADTLAQRLANPRRCAACKQTKPLDQFGAQRGRPNGRRGTCKGCVNERQRVRRSTPEGKAENLRAWYKSNARALERARAQQSPALPPAKHDTIHI